MGQLIQFVAFLFRERASWYPCLSQQLPELLDLSQGFVPLVFQVLRNQAILGVDQIVLLEAAIGFKFGLCQ